MPREAPPSSHMPARQQLAQRLRALVAGRKALDAAQAGEGLRGHAEVEPALAEQDQRLDGFAFVAQALEEEVGGRLMGLPVGELAAEKQRQVEVLADVVEIVPGEAERLGVMVGEALGQAHLAHAQGLQDAAGGLGIVAGGAHIGQQFVGLHDTKIALHALFELEIVVGAVALHRAREGQLRAQRIELRQLGDHAADEGDAAAVTAAGPEAALRAQEIPAEGVVIDAEGEAAVVRDAGQEGLGQLGGIGKALVGAEHEHRPPRKCRQPLHTGEAAERKWHDGQRELCPVFLQQRIQQGVFVITLFDRDKTVLRLQLAEDLGIAEIGIGNLAFQGDLDLGKLAFFDTEIILRDAVPEVVGDDGDGARGLFGADHEAAVAQGQTGARHRVELRKVHQPLVPPFAEGRMLHPELDIGLGKIGQYVAERRLAGRKFRETGHEVAQAMKRKLPRTRAQLDDGDRSRKFGFLSVQNKTLQHVRISARHDIVAGDIVRHGAIGPGLLSRLVKIRALQVPNDGFGETYGRLDRVTLRGFQGRRDMRDAGNTVHFFGQRRLQGRTHGGQI